MLHIAAQGTGAVLRVIGRVHNGGLGRRRQLAADLLVSQAVVELGDLQVGGGELFARECTYNLYKDATLGCYKRFIYESTETTASDA